MRFRRTILSVEIFRYDDTSSNSREMQTIAPGSAIWTPRTSFVTMQGLVSVEREIIINFLTYVAPYWNMYIDIPYPKYRINGMN